MQKATGVFNKNFTSGVSDGALFGGFAEHMGRVIYGGLYEPGHPAADKDGFRQDVLELVRSLNMPLMRYPGGNFVSAYDWRTGVGPRKERKKHIDPAWNTEESNEFALDEFLSWCGKAQCEAVLALNLGTGTPEMALELFDYCNGTGGTYWSEKRKEWASREPRNIRYWCLGNEMSSPRQPGHKTAEDYARLAGSIAKQLKEKDPSCRLILSGSSCRNAAYYGYWDDRILEETYDDVDFLSLHAYYGPKGDDLAGYLSSDLVLDAHIHEAAAFCDAAAARKKSSKKLYLALDEWNVWSGTNRPVRQVVSDFEDIYTALDAVVLGGLLMTMLSNCDRLKLACLAQTCNILAPIMTVPGKNAWRQTIYHPFALTSRFGRGIVLQGVAKSPLAAVSPDGRRCPAFKTTAVYDETNGDITVFLLNRSWDEELDISLKLEDFLIENITESFLISADDPGAVNSAEEERVKPGRLKDLRPDTTGFSAILPARSWGLVRLKLQKG